MARVDSISGVTVFNKDSFVDNRGELYTAWKDTDTPELTFNHDKIALSNKVTDRHRLVFRLHPP